MHIVFTFPWALDMPGGGPVDYLQTAYHLASAGVELTLLTVASAAPDRFPRQKITNLSCKNKLQEDLINLGVKILQVPQNPFYYFGDGLSLRKEFIKVLKKKSVDVVLGWQHEIAFLPQLLHSKGVILAVLASNGYYAEWYHDCNRVGRFFRDRFVITPMKKADVIFARSNFIRNLIVDLFEIDAQRIVINYCGVDPLFLNVKRRKSERIKHFIYFGGFTPEKGIFDALMALGKVAKQGYQNWNFKIIGWGDKNSVKKVARENGIEDRIEVIDFLPQVKLVRELEWAHLAILPSYGESFGLAFAEAQAAGLPVIGYEVGGVPEIIKNNITGWLLQKGCVDGLVKKILEAINNPEKAHKMGINGRKNVKKRFSWPSTVEAMIKKLKETKTKAAL